MKRSNIAFDILKKIHVWRALYKSYKTGSICVINSVKAAQHIVDGENHAEL